MKPNYADDQVSIYQGDALAVLRELPTGSVDALITDPPYSSGGMVRGDRTASTTAKYVQSQTVDKGVEFTGDNRDQRAYAYWCALWLSEALRVTKPGGVCLLFTDWRQLPATSDALQAGGWIWRGLVPWVKTSARPAGANRFTNQCEYVIWGSAGPMPLDHSGGAIGGFFHASSPRDREHQTQKPLSVMRDLVQIVPEGCTVLDPFMGSGTTGIAAVMERRRFVGVELHSHYAQLAASRIGQASSGLDPQQPEGTLL